MNKTQKSAVFSLVMFLFCAVVITYAFLTMFLITPKVSPIWTLVVPFGIILVTSIVWVRKKQSPTEVDFDERDDIIKKRAVIAGFISVWILLAIESVIPTIILGDKGSIPVSMLPIINVSIFIIAMMVCSIAVLVQYGWGRKDGEK
ncbi:hypothetical protein ACFL1G_10675 [Planctomycetota bacterium]